MNQAWFSSRAGLRKSLPSASYPKTATPLGNFILRLTPHTAVIPSKARNLSSATGTPPYGCTVEVVLRHRVERFSRRGQTPKTAARWLASLKLLQFRWRGVQKSHRHRSPKQSHRCRDSFAQFFHAVPTDSSPVFCFETPRPASNHLKLERISRCSFRTADIQKTAKIATISTCTDKKLHFSRIFRLITLAFSYRVRYSPLGSNFFAQYSRVDERILQPARVSRDGKKSTGG